MFDDTGSSPCSVVVVSPHQLRSRHHDCKWRQKGTKFRSSLMALAQKNSHQLNGDSLDITGDGAVSQPPFSGSQPASHCWVMIWSSFSVGKCSYWLYQPPAPDPARKKRQLFSPRAQTAVTDRPSLLIAAKWEGSTKKSEIKIQWQSLVLSMNCICHLFVSFDKSCNYLFRFKRSTCRTQSCDVTWLWTTFFGRQKNVGPSALSKSQPPDVKHEQVSFHLGSSISQVKMARGPAFVTSTGSAGNQQLVILTIWKYHQSVPAKRPEFCKKRADFI